MEKESIVDVFVMSMSCDKCTEGELLPAYTNESEQGILHECNKCDHTDTLELKYPFVQYRAKKEV